jgi:DNA-binding response OmpR family regulator
MVKILVVDDSVEVLSVVSAALVGLKIQVVPAASATEANHLIQESKFDLILLDLGLPDGDGLVILNQIRSNQKIAKTPVIIISANIELSSKLSAFSIGADDYVTKPFNVLELRARVEAKLRRFAEAKEAQETFQAGPLTLDSNKQQVFVIESQQLVHLSPTEFRLLALMARRPGVIFSREKFLDQIWGQEISVTDRTVDTHIYSLRKKLGSLGNLIRSVQGEGYRFISS